MTSELDECPMKALQFCRAHSKQTGFPCKKPVVRGWNVCRMHGAGGGSKPGVHANAYKHGLRSAEVVALRKLANQMRRDLDQTVRERTLRGLITGDVSLSEALFGASGARKSAKIPWLGRDHVPMQSLS